MGEDKKEQEQEKNVTNTETEKENIVNVSKDENVEETAESKDTETTKIQNEKDETEYVPEQLDDDDFEKEKAREKEERKAKKLDKQSKKEKQKIEYDENGNPIKIKKPKTKLFVTFLLLILIVVGVVAYFVISFNQPQNIVQDFAIYFNNEDWENVADCVDMQGYITMFLIDVENYEEDEDEDTETTTASYADYDSRYVDAYNDIEGSDYEYIYDIIEYGKENASDCLANYSGYNFTIESIKSVEKIGNTDSLYKISFLCTLEYSGDSETDTYTTYVSKTDGKYKIIYGDFADAVFSVYYYEYLYSYYY